MRKAEANKTEAMNNFGQLISHLAKKAGIPDDDQHLVGVLSNAELTRVNVPQDMFSAIDNRLLSIDDAKNNHPLVKAHYFAQAFNGLDSELERIKDELGLDDATWQELQGERSSTKRAAALVKKVKELTEKKAGAEPKAKDALQKQIDQLTTELVESKKDIQKEKDTAASTLRQMKIEGKLDAMVSTLPTIYDELDSEVRAMTVRNILQKAQAENDIEFVLDDAGQFDLLKKDGSKFYSENHQLIKPKDFIEKTLKTPIKIVSIGAERNQTIFKHA